MLCEMTKTDTEGKCGDATSFLGRGKPLVSPSTPFRGLFCATEWYLSLSQLRCQLPHQMEPVDRRRDRYAFCGNEETATSSDSLCDPPSTREKAESLASALSAASRAAERIVAAPAHPMELLGPVWHRSPPSKRRKPRSLLSEVFVFLMKLFALCKILMPLPASKSEFQLRNAHATPALPAEFQLRNAQAAAALRLRH